MVVTAGVFELQRSFFDIDMENHKIDADLHRYTQINRPIKPFLLNALFLSFVGIADAQWLETTAKRVRS